MSYLERYFMTAKQIDENKECFAFTKECADEFVKRFGFLTRYGFKLEQKSHRSILRTCNLGMRENFVLVENPKLDYKGEVFFPMTRIQNGGCDFCSYSFDPTHSGYIEEYTYASGAMTIATLFG